MVKIEYVDGTEESVVTFDNSAYGGDFHYDERFECFVIHDRNSVYNCMMVPREFVKSIRHIDCKQEVTPNGDISHKNQGLGGFQDGND